VIVCGNASEAGDAEGLATDLGLPVDMFDVEDNAPAGLAKAGPSPGCLARFGAVLGMALGEADGREPVVDFLHVRRRKEGQQFTRQHVLAATAAALALLFLGLLLWQRSASLSREINGLNAQTADLEAKFEQQQLAATIEQAESVDQWLATDVNWLDELDRLSRSWRRQPLDAKRFPMADDAVVMQLTAYRPPGNQSQGGRLAVQAVARSQSAVAALEKRLRDGGHRVATGGGKQDSTVPGYGWSFGLTMDVAPQDAPQENAAEAAP
jgi:Tfp pilus assembly protein PilN